MSVESDSGRVAAIYIAEAAGAPMEPLEQIKAMAGFGLEGDRYALGTGAYSRASRETIRHVTLFAREVIDAANAENGTDFSEADTRRNIVTEAVELNGLVGVRFAIASVALRGVELCTPCVRPDKLSGKRGFNEAFQDRGGLRAEVLSSGLIRVGDFVG